MKRECTECRNEFVGERNLCRTCRNRMRRELWKKNKRYYQPDPERPLPKAVLLRQRNDLSRKEEIFRLRQRALEKQEERILSEILAIREAGLDPDNDTIQTILEAGVTLTDFSYKHTG